MSESGGKDREERVLEEHLRSVLAAADPVPEHVRAGAVAAFAWRTVDGELAELTFDSLLDERVPADVRGVGGPRLVTFTAPALTVEVEIVEHGRARRLTGQLVPPAAGCVQVRHLGGTLSAEADELGRFAVEGVMPGPVRIRCEVTGPQRAVETDWVTL